MAGVVSMDGFGSVGLVNESVVGELGNRLVVSEHSVVLRLWKMSPGEGGVR